MADLVEEVQAVTGQTLTLAYVDQGYTGQETAQSAAQYDTDLHVVQLPQAKNGFVLLTKGGVVERFFAWATRFRRLARDYERLTTTLTGRVCLLEARQSPSRQPPESLTRSGPPQLILAFDGDQARLRVGKERNYTKYSGSASASWIWLPSKIHCKNFGNAHDPHR
ncbi:MAG: hypothetical protein NVS3B25_24210 [Hymenobacter sp.]